LVLGLVLDRDHHLDHRDRAGDGDREVHRPLARWDRVADWNYFLRRHSARRLGMNPIGHRTDHLYFHLYLPKNYRHFDLARHPSDHRDDHDRHGDRDDGADFHLDSWLVELDCLDQSAPRLQ
jgi:hypothetical protein